MNHCLVIDEPSSVPLSTPKAVHTTILLFKMHLQIILAVCSRFLRVSCMPQMLHWENAFLPGCMQLTMSSALYLCKILSWQFCMFRKLHDQTQISKQHYKSLSA